MKKDAVKEFWHFKKRSFEKASKWRVCYSALQWGAFQNKLRF